ncbi:cupin domain-containing protein [Lysobacter sp. S4-A87]|uniref:cupin domain-containing protein n=1 Tax=Lysobacter sp. S4-A87 TaxID=2925843 RepID=UPI001F531737|nr:cupin domain-containing protein [Lysobacter sp. S4-A87]UNK49916.1 cupin domain-containing protein [Lysobacter sp. S4-A87]
MKQIHVATLLAALLTGASVAIGHAENSGISRHEALRHDLDTPGRELVQVRVDFAPGSAFGMHTHPGVEVAYVLEGTLEYSFEGKPPVTLKAGQSLYIPAGEAHAARNVGKDNGAELATYLVEKGKPIVVPRPARP